MIIPYLKLLPLTFVAAFIGASLGYTTLWLLTTF